MAEIKRCKYLLPCGYCDKYDIPCKVSREDMANHYYNVTLTEKENNTFSCSHDWRLETSILNEDGYTERHHCAKCGETKTLRVTRA